MDDLKNKLTILLAKDEWSDEDKRWMADYLKEHGEAELQEILRTQFESGVSDQHSPEDSLGILQAIHQKAGIEEIERTGVILSLKKFLVAASAVAIVSLAAYFFWGKSVAEPEDSKLTEIVTDVLPGGNKAILMLDDGSSIVLDEAGDGMLTQQGGVQIEKNGDRVNYRTTDERNRKQVFNTVITPRGGVYNINLSDGTKVWLNTASSIRFPALFPENERVVEITGEVYFEVAPKKETGINIPFIVKITGANGEGGEVNVLGTHFNINAYTDESSVVTTLFEGAVEYKNSNYSRRLMPGQQSVFSKNEGIRIATSQRIADVIAWKNGSFQFYGSNLEDMLRQLARWYDVDIVYDRKVSDKFYAEIPMHTMLSDALKALELTDLVKFKIENKKVIVY